MATATKTQARRSVSLTGAAGDETSPAARRAARGGALTSQQEAEAAKAAGVTKGMAKTGSGRGAKAQPDAHAHAFNGAAKPSRAKINGAVIDGTGVMPAAQESAASGDAVQAAAAPGSDAEHEVVRPDYWDKACADLVKRDRILKKLIPKFGPVHLMSSDDPFVTLARSVVGQQISTAAAQALWKRVEAACPKLVPQQFIKLGHEKLAACGLSKRKTEYILDLAQHFVSGALHVGKWTTMDDEDVIAELTAIRGIGRWTAEMFLIFNLARPNVLPLDDLGLIQAISVNYFSGEPVTRSEAREVAANWEPWRTVATWYMWRSLEHA
ncbi:DNA-3-methyladenine glycosylase II [Paraburkholderia eburnea]|uniref:DNA-3-methyladenine glycosylase II n=1 Tax=Paraburkholderia eburnea TaxID=1189126 RepID=A0A2S4MGI1_9BURK|nr:DNA-3-methyladenine glycosylase [Paraburkholderia eburnea]POR53735.1 DNA-3-methyladenine glycosylase II [Paraburkholderia eburnea]PRZ25703.1 DNA-3-methyladenine glycosylase II [Paraburkholderia eburnea]